MEKLWEQIAVRFESRGGSWTSFDSWFEVQCRSYHRCAGALFKIGMWSLLGAFVLFMRMRLLHETHYSDDALVDDAVQSPFSLGFWLFAGTLSAGLVAHLMIEQRQRKFTRLPNSKTKGKAQNANLSSLPACGDRDAVQGVLDAIRDAEQLSTVIMKREQTHLSQRRAHTSEPELAGMSDDDATQLDNSSYTDPLLEWTRKEARLAAKEARKRANLAAGHKTATGVSHDLERAVKHVDHWYELRTNQQGVFAQITTEEGPPEVRPARLLEEALLLADRLCGALTLDDGGGGKRGSAGRVASVRRQNKA